MALHEAIKNQAQAAKKKKRREICGYDRLDGEGKAHLAVAAGKVVDDSSEQRAEETFAIFDTPARSRGSNNGYRGKRFAAIGAL